MGPTVARRLGTLGLVLMIALVPSGCRHNRMATPTELSRPIAATTPGGALQEVPPPRGTELLQASLQQRSPQVKIEHPADGSGLPAGDWSLELSVRDWPLVDAGPLGLGPHVVIQIDERAPLRIRAAGAPGSEAAVQSVPGDRIRVTMPPLDPGSHRVTAYAARPWGESVKARAASDQIRVHRVAPNPLSLPAAGSPQLIPVSPEVLSPREPVLIDWLLRDAPLQGLREGDDGWRLRITVNGDSFLVEENTPLWLRGWQRGSNTVLMELVDGQGAPLNPPFNSLVREVWIDPDQPAPLWSQGSPTLEQQQILLGERPLPEAPAIVGVPVRRDPKPEPEASQTLEPEPEPLPTVPPPGRSPGARAPRELTNDQQASAAISPASESEVSPPPEPPAPEPSPSAIASGPEPPAPMEAGPGPEAEAGESANPAGGELKEVMPESPAQPEPGEPSESASAEARASNRQPQSGIETANEVPPVSPVPFHADRSAAKASGPGPGVNTARQQLNPDGTLIRPERRGPLAGLRERWAP